MAREEQLIREYQQNYVPDVSILYTNAYDAVKEVVLKCLREAFAAHPIHTYIPDPSRGWSYPDLEHTQIVIFEDYPLETLFLPALTVNIGSKRDHPVSFNQNLLCINYLFDEHGKQVFDNFGRPIPIYYEYAGAWDINFNIVINTQSPIDRDVIVDYVTIVMMHLYRDWLYTRGIHVKTVSTGGEETLDWQDDKIYKTSVSCELYTEWTNRIPIKGPTVDKLNLCIGSPISNSALVPEGVVKDGIGINYEGKEVLFPSVSSDVTTVDCYNDQRPTNAFDTVIYNPNSQQYEITEEWLEFIARYFDVELLQQRYGIESIANLTMINWFDMMAALSSPARMGFLTLTSQTRAKIIEVADRLGVPTDTVDDGYGTYAELTLLNDLLAYLVSTYQTDVTRYEIG